MSEVLVNSSWNSAVYTPPSKFYEYLVKVGIEGEIEPHGTKFVFRCPVCKDSQKVKSKKRGYLITNDDGKSTMGCHNCEHKMSFTAYLKMYHSDLYRQWIQDVYVGINFKAQDNSFVEAVRIRDDEVVDYGLFKPLTDRADSKVRSSAIDFIVSRKIPKCVAKKFLYCDEGRYQNRIIMPHFNRDGTYKHFEARDLSGNAFIRYLYPLGWEDNVYNLCNLKLDQPFFVKEGAVDSMFVRNSIACRGVHKINSVINGIMVRFHPNLIVFADGDKDGIVAGFKYLKKGYKVFKWTKEMIACGKDVNALIMNGFFKSEDFDREGMLHTSAIMKHVVEPSMGSILQYQLDALDLGYILERKYQRVNTITGQREVNWTPR